MPKNTLSVSRKCNPGTVLLGLTNLHGVCPDILQTSIDLFSHEFGRHHMDILDTKGILRRQRSGCCKRIAFMGRENPLVRLKATVLCRVSNYFKDISYRDGRN